MTFSSSLSISDVDDILLGLVVDCLTLVRGSVSMDSATLRSSARLVWQENDSDLVRVDVMMRDSSWTLLLALLSDPFEPDSDLRP